MRWAFSLALAPRTAWVAALSLVWVAAALTEDVQGFLTAHYRRRA